MLVTIRCKIELVDVGFYASAAPRGRPRGRRWACTSLCCSRQATYLLCPCQCVSETKKIPDIFICVRIYLRGTSRVCRPVDPPQAQARQLSWSTLPSRSHHEHHYSNPTTSTSHVRIYLYIYVGIYFIYHYHERNNFD